MANNNSHQGELFELTQSDAIKRAAFEASNRSYKSLQEVLNSYSLIEDNMKSNFIVCMNYVTKNGLILSCLLYTSDAARSTLCRSRWSPYH